MQGCQAVSIAVDYSVLDHLYRIEAGTYKGPNEMPLTRFRRAAELGVVDVLISEITPVEMLQGLENVATDSARLA